MRIYYLFYSFFYFVRFLFLKKSYKIIFYYPHHFNRGLNGLNLYFSHLCKLCDEANLSYLVFEEPDYSSKKRRSRDAIPFDFIYCLVILLRKVYPKEMNYIIKDNKIGSLLNIFLFRNLYFDNVITISQSMISVFRGIYPESNIFDLQHGIIYSKKESYINDGVVAKNIEMNNVNLLLVGDGFKQALVMSEKEDYYNNHAHILGCFLIQKRI